MKLQLLSDNTAIGLSMLCIAHCLFLPIIIIFIPAISGILFLNNDLFHQWLLYAVFTISPMSLLFGFLNHKNRSVLFFGFLGLILLVLALFLGHKIIGEYGEIILTILGSSILAYGHVLNYQLRQQQCTNPTK